MYEDYDLLPALASLTPAALGFIGKVINLLEDQTIDEGQDELPLDFWQSFDTLCDIEQFGRDLMLSVWNRQGDQNEYIGVRAVA
jgi:hypothetical protein